MTSYSIPNASSRMHGAEQLSSPPLDLDSFNTLRLQANRVRELWYRVPTSCTDAAAVTEVEASITELCRLLDMPSRTSSQGESSGCCKHFAAESIPEGLNGFAVLNKDEWGAVIDAAETALRVPGSSLPSNVLRLLRAVTFTEAGLNRSSVAPVDSSTEPACIIEILCDYLDLILVPSTLRRPSLREDAVRCPCGRCLAAAQALQRLQHSSTLAAILQASVLPFLCGILDRHAGLSDNHEESTDNAIRAAECLAVFATVSRLQDGVQFDLPFRTLSSLQRLMHVVSPLSISSSSICSSCEPVTSGQSLLRVVHVLRNVVGNHTEVLDSSSETLAAYGRHIWSHLELLAKEASSPPQRPGSGSRRRATADRSTSSGFAGAREESPRERSSSSRAPARQADPSQHYPQNIAASAVASSLPEGAAEFSSGGNPQESDEYTSGAEVSPPILEASAPKEQTFQAEEIREDEGSRQRSQSPIGSVASSSTDSLDLGRRCAEILSLFSMTLQALYQTDEALRQPEVFASEDAVRWQLVALAQPLRAAGPPLPAKWRERLAFHGIRLYLLISRSSHTRRQYVVLQPPFVDSERRMVAFMLSLTPPSQRCCVLLRAMAQDVNSWLSWQAQAKPSSLPNRAPRPSATPRVGSRERPRRRRSVQPDAGTSSAPASKTRQRSPKHKSRSQPTEGSSVTGSMFGEEAAHLSRLFSAESGEAVWLVHAGLLFIFVLCLLALWSSLEHPRGVGLGNTWRFQL